jgi:hypothetical protein
MQETRTTEHDEIKKAYMTGKISKIEAIKRYRGLYIVGLLESKNAVDEWEKRPEWYWRPGKYRVTLDNGCFVSPGSPVLRNGDVIRVIGFESCSNPFSCNCNVCPGMFVVANRPGLQCFAKDGILRVEFIEELPKTEVFTARRRMILK